MPSGRPVVDEQAGNHWQTSPLQVDDSFRVARVAVAILEREVNRAEWRSPVIQRGSLTLRHRSDPHIAIKIFIDHGARLWAKIGFSGPAPSEAPLVIAVELTSLEPTDRSFQRDILRGRFKYYADPRQAPYTKWMIKPNVDHVYDLIVLPPGSCPDVNEEAVEALSERIRAAMEA